MQIDKSGRSILKDLQLTGLSPAAQPRTSADPEQKKQKLNAELANGRLAMTVKGIELIDFI